MHLVSHLLPPQNPKCSPIFSQVSLRNSYCIPELGRVSTKTPSVKCRHSENFEQQRFTRPSEDSFAPQSPEGAFKLSKEGFVLLQFAPAVGLRQYDWSRKQVFSLSVTEIGTLINLGAKGSCEFFHDPFKGKSEEGKVRKVLKAEPLPDGSGHFFNLSVQNKLLNVDESIYIPITKAELTVLVSAFNFILPYLIGWHAFVDSIKPDDPGRVSNASPNYQADLEWSR
ncbi:PREDICTED: single-stranded DNA-binding protein WHY1, chloroplastic-like isoform X3 [Nelumbo nucifera]|uniref:Single-stranded DNA-binding protein WHY1, chloroplastic-like isoform X3 n=1 Tax=Nelumbo nucifera TaxID=4432 RepID=A0A1U7Z4S6_NELNU|nr:PREDICTED: single-stranded DNA-binding protein WHY1, chloroplastic-like isoform X3 [Nelumbo nucifera]